MCLYAKTFEYWPKAPPLLYFNRGVAFDNRRTASWIRAFTARRPRGGARNAPRHPYALKNLITELMDHQLNTGTAEGGRSERSTSLRDMGPSELCK